MNKKIKIILLFLCSFIVYNSYGSDLSVAHAYRYAVMKKAKGSDILLLGEVFENNNSLESRIYESFLFDEKRIVIAKISSHINKEKIRAKGFCSSIISDLKAENILLWQRNNGGWPKEPHNNFSGYNRAQTEKEKVLALSTKNSTDTTIDNNHTVGEIKYLLKAYKLTNNINYLTGAIKGVDYLLVAQYDNGGWPQYYPDKSAYRHQITFNDNAMVNVMNLMWDISKGINNTDVLDVKYKEKAINAFAKGIDIILQTQISIDGKKTGWCAQYDEVTLLPALARSYELPSISGSESVGIVRVLMLVENPSFEIIHSIHSAVDWFNKVKIKDLGIQKTFNPEDMKVVSKPGNIMWARFYDLKTQQPFFSGRDGVKKNTLAEIEIERRVGYAWYVKGPNKLIGTQYTKWKSKHGL
ncbi:pectate lyase [Pseudalgibacter alginicilyticus]|nr:pectate lyase [Pseudalgibacter alginicilyticus]